MRKILQVVMLLAVLSAGALSQVTSDYFGNTVQKTTTAWPTVPFGTQRLWDTNTGWAAINTSSGVYNWTVLDAWMTSASTHNVSLLYTFGRTPQWASSNPTLTTCSYGAGQCAPPANMADWDAYVTAIATRSAGRIKYWELWNEPNLASFYTGSLSTLVTMAQHAYTIIKGIDPSAVILTPCPTGSSTYSGGFEPFIWMDDYLTAGGGPYADVIAFHGYPDRANPEGSLTTKINGMKSVMTSHGVGSKELWDTEASWGKTTDYPDTQLQAGFLARMYLYQYGKGISRFYWYGWEFSPWGTLWDSTSGIHPAGTAYGEVYKWMVGATVSACTNSGTVYTCNMTRTSPAGYTAQAVWNTAGSSSYSTTYKSYSRLDGTTGISVSGGAVTIGQLPILLYNPPTGTTTITTSTDHAKVGTHSTKIVLVTPGAANFVRSKEAHTSTYMAGGLYYSSYYWFPSVTTVGSAKFMLMQVRSTHAAGHTSFFQLAVGNRGGGAMFLQLIWPDPAGITGPHSGETGVKTYTQTAKDLPTGKWVHIEMYLLQSTAFSGRVSIYQDGALILDQSSVKTKYSDGTNEWVYGTEASATLSPSTVTTYLDYTRISTVRVGP